MSQTAEERLITIADLSTILGCRLTPSTAGAIAGKAQGATASAATFAIAAPASRPGWRNRPTAVSPHGNRRMAHIERPRIRQPDASGRGRVVTRYRVRYRAESGRRHCETKMRLIDAERRKAEIELALAGGTWHHPCRGEMRLHERIELRLPTRHDLRATTWARLETTVQKQVLPRFGNAALRVITNSCIRQWISDLLASGLSAATTVAWHALPN